MNSNNSLFQWLSARDAGIADLATSHSGEDITPFLETLLWDNATSFVNEVLHNLRCGRRNAGQLMQYISYPFYSHFRQINKQKPSWIPHFPLYFRNGLKDPTTSDVIARYATLYRGLQITPDCFSFSALASDASWALNPPPRYVVMNLDALPLNATIQVAPEYTSDVLWLNAKIPFEHSPEPNRLNLVRRCISGTAVRFPLFGNSFSLNEFSPFWKWFEDLLQSNECSAAFEELRLSTKVNEPELATALRQKFSLISRLQEKTELLSKAIAPFLLWNLTLGFRRVIYIPFRTVEPRKDSMPTVRSWAGAVLCLTNDVELSPQSLKVLMPRGDANHLESHAEVAPLVIALKTLVDIASSRASIGDWKYYHRTYELGTLEKEHAKMMWRGFEHEVRNLQLTVGLAVPDEMQSDELLSDLHVNLEISKLASEASIDRDKKVTVQTLLRDLKAILHWGALELDDTPCYKFLKYSVPQPLRFVLAELCRNAYNHSPDNFRKVRLAIEITSSGEIHAAVSNRTLNRRLPKTAYSETGFGGHALVKNVVERILSGVFTFDISKSGRALATVSLPSEAPEKCTIQ